MPIQLKATVAERALDPLVNPAARVGCVVMAWGPVGMGGGRLDGRGALTPKTMEGSVIMRAFADRPVGSPQGPQRFDPPRSRPGN